VLQPASQPLGNLSEAAEIIREEAEDICKGREQLGMEVVRKPFLAGQLAKNGLISFITPVALRPAPPVARFAYIPVHKEQRLVVRGGGRVRMDGDLAGFLMGLRPSRVAEPKQRSCRDRLICITNQHQDTWTLLMRSGKAVDSGLE
jgi:hypothetical protein